MALVFVKNHSKKKNIQLSFFLLFVLPIQPLRHPIMSTIQIYQNKSKIFHNQTFSEVRVRGSHNAQQRRIHTKKTKQKQKTNITLLENNHQQQRTNHNQHTHRQRRPRVQIGGRGSRLTGKRGWRRSGSGGWEGEG